MNISIKEAMAVLGYDSQPQTHAFIKRWDIVKIKDGARTYIDDADLERAMAEAEKSGGRKKLTEEEKADRAAKKKAGKAGADEEAAVELGFMPFEKDPRLLLWNKGEYRGWAFGAIKDVTEELVGVVKDYCSDMAYWLPKGVTEAIGRREMFIVEPSQVVGFLAAQLMGTQDSAFDEVIEELEIISLKLKAGENEYKEAQR